MAGGRLGPADGLARLAALAHQPARYGPRATRWASAAASVGVASNVFARCLRRPTTVLRLPGLLLLVPGSLGFRSVASLLDADAVAGTDGLFRVALVAVALAAGSFAADLLVPPRRSL
ncbi:MAG: threonine/serine exporter family protein [Myxococcota bacterium]